MALPGSRALHVKRVYFCNKDKKKSPDHLGANVVFCFSPGATHDAYGLGLDLDLEGRLRRPPVRKYGVIRPTVLVLVSSDVHFLQSAEQCLLELWRAHR